MATDITISMEDKPGGLASVGEALGAAGVNIEGLCGMGFEGRGIIHVCVKDGATARAALEAAGLKVEGEADAILSEPMADVDKPGQLGVVARAMANAGINVKVAYVATNSRMVTVTSDNAKVLEMMAAM